MKQHPLRSEIIATKLTNNMLNDMGMNYVYRICEETGAGVDEIATSYAVVKGIFGLDSLWQEVQALDNKVSSDVQLQMLDSMRRTLRRASRWYLRHGSKTDDIQQSIDTYRATFIDLSENIKEYLVPNELTELEKASTKLADKGVPPELAFKVAALGNLFPCMDLTQVAACEGIDIKLVSNLYFKLGSELELHWFLAQIDKQAVSNHWQALARASYREELDWQQRSITSVLLSGAKKEQDAKVILKNWMDNNHSLLDRWYHMMSEFKTSSTHEFAKFSVALRELMLLSINASN